MSYRIIDLTRLPQPGKMATPEQMAYAEWVQSIIRPSNGPTRAQQRDRQLAQAKAKRRRK